MTTDNKAPREFWIRTEPEFDHITKFEEDSGHNHIHVIEKSCADKLEKERDELKAKERLHETIVKQLQRGHSAQIESLELALRKEQAVSAKLREELRGYVEIYFEDREIKGIAIAATKRKMQEIDDLCAKVREETR